MSAAIPESGSSYGGLALFALLAMCGDAAAVELRTYTPSRHDRFTGFPGAPAWNDSAYYGSRKFTGVAWIPDDPRQMALISPVHLVMAGHYSVGAGTSVRFLNSSGQVVDRVITGGTSIQDSSGQASDLYLVGLNAPVTADGVGFFPYLNLANEAAYVGKELLIFGWTARAGRATSVNAFQDADIGGRPTRLMAFVSPKTGTNPDDANLVLNDSGSPTFVISGGNPALVGIHATIGSNDNYYVGFDTFIPHYIAGLNTVMDSSGYRMTPFTPPAVTLSTALVTATPLRQGRSGTCRFDLANTGANDGGNAKVNLHFPVGTGPDSIAASGWIAETTGPQDWSFRRANLATGTTASFTATWATLPLQSAIAVGMTRATDGSAVSTNTLTVNLSPSFISWAAALADTTVTGDSDGDGVGNFLEYAFGGDPAAASLSSAAGNILLPVVTTQAGRAVVRFPVRDDAAARALNYVVEYSATLEAGSWSTTPPSGLLDQTVDFSPDIPGFTQRSVSWDATAARLFCRVRVEE